VYLPDQAAPCKVGLKHRLRIGDPEGRKPDQEGQANQPGIPEPSREPPSQYLQSLHAFSNVSFDRICPEGANWGAQVQSRLALTPLFILLAFNKKWQRLHVCRLAGPNGG